MKLLIGRDHAMAEFPYEDPARGGVFVIRPGVAAERSDRDDRVALSDKFQRLKRRDINRTEDRPKKSRNKVRLFKYFFEELDFTFFYCPVDCCADSNFINRTNR